MDESQDKTSEELMYMVYKYDSVYLHQVELYPSYLHQVESLTGGEHAPTLSLPLLSR